MHIAILTFEGFNELDSLIALGILNRIKTPGWRLRQAHGKANDVSKRTQPCIARSALGPLGLMSPPVVTEPVGGNIVIERMAGSPEGGRREVS